MKLIVNGDDFGITHACNLAIIDCFKYGIMKSTSMMTNMPCAKEAAKLWQQHPNLSVGIHLNLTVGFPLCKDLKTLVKEDGSFDKNILFGEKYVNIEEMMKECEAQIGMFISLTGRKPDHINSHHGLEAIQGGEQVIQQLSIKYDIPIRQLTRVKNPEALEYITSYVIPIKKATKLPVEDVDEIINLFSQEELASDNYYEWLGHPGYVDYELMKLSSYTTNRCLDAQCFCNEKIKDWIIKNKIELISYLDLPKKCL